MRDRGLGAGVGPYIGCWLHVSATWPTAEVLIRRSTRLSTSPTAPSRSLNLHIPHSLRDHCRLRGLSQASRCQPPPPNLVDNGSQLAAASVGGVSLTTQKVTLFQNESKSGCLIWDGSWWVVSRNSGVPLGHSCPSQIGAEPPQPVFPCIFFFLSSEIPCGRSGCFRLRWKGLGNWRVLPKGWETPEGLGQRCGTAAFWPPPKTTQPSPRCDSLLQSASVPPQTLRHWPSSCAILTPPSLQPLYPVHRWGGGLDWLPTGWGRQGVAGEGSDKHIHALTWGCVCWTRSTALTPQLQPSAAFPCSFSSSRLPSPNPRTHPLPR